MCFGSLRRVRFTLVVALGASCPGRGQFYTRTTLPKGLVAWGTNDSGDVVGYYDFRPGLLHGFLYSKGVLTDLGTLVGSHQSRAFALNNLGQIVGTSNSASFGDNHAFL